MNKSHKILAFFGTFSACLVISAFSQQVTIPFNTSAEYTNNFTEVRDANNGLGWNSGGYVSNNPGNTGAAVYSPNGATIAVAPTFPTSTVEVDVNAANYTSGASTVGLLSRVQSDGTGVLAAFYPGRSGVSLAISYGQISTGFTSLSGGTIYSNSFSDFSFSPVHISLAAYQSGGVPVFDFIIRSSDGRQFDTGPVALTGTTAFNNAGAVGFYANSNIAGGAGFDNFSISPTVPEPGTWSLCGAALLAGTGWLRKRQAA